VSELLLHLAGGVALNCVANTSLYAHGPFELAVRYQWIDSMFHASDAGTGERNQPGVASRQYVDMLGSWNVTDATRVSFGITNLFDKEPPEWEADGFTDTALYDILGRRYFMSLSHRF
jgi:iron complex outermembrane recepter protein